MKDNILPFDMDAWDADMGVQALSLEEQMIWFKMIMIMWKSSERGYLTLGGKPMETSALANIIRFDEILLKQKLSKFCGMCIFSTREDGAIFSRFIVRHVEIAKIRSESGKKGGNPKLVGGLLKQNSSKRITTKKTKPQPNSEILLENTQTPYIYSTYSTVFSKRIKEYLEKIRVRAESENDFDPELFIKYLRFMDWVEKKTPAVNKMEEPFNYDQWRKLIKEIPAEQVNILLHAMNNHAQLLKKNKIAYMTLMNWHRMDQERRSAKTKPTTPTFERLTKDNG